MSKNYLGDEKRQRRLKEREADYQRQLTADLQALLATPLGRRVVWWVLADVTGLFGKIATCDATAFYHEGRRSVGVDLMEKFQETSANDYALMIQERMQELAVNKTTREAILKKGADEETYDGSGT